MVKIYDDAKDKNVAAVIIYGKDTDGKAYADTEGKTQLKTSELQDAFIKRALIKIGDDYFVPTGFSVASKIGTVTKAGSTAGSAATATLVSVAD